MPVVIKDKVGILCTNRFEDVLTIQDALNRVSVGQGRAVPPLTPNGICDKRTTDAIQKFQLKQFGWPGADGKIFPGGQTITRINQLLPDPVPAPEKKTGMNWRLEFNTGNSRSLSKLGPWYLYFTDLDAEMSFRFWLSKPQVSAGQDEYFSTPYEFTTDPMSPLDFENAIFRYEDTLIYRGLPPITLGSQSVFHQKSESYGTAAFQLANGTKFWLLQMPLRIAEVSLMAKVPGVYRDFVIGRLKNTSK